MVKDSDTFTAVSLVLVPGWGTKIPQATQYSQKKKKISGQIEERTWTSILVPALWLAVVHSCTYTMLC